MEGILYVITCAMYSLFETYAVYKFMRMFLGNTFCEKKYVVLTYASRLVVGAIQYGYLPYAWINLTVGVVLLILITLCYNGSWKKRVLAVVLVYMCLFVTEIFVAIIYALFNMDIVMNGHNTGEFTYIAMTIILALIVKIIESRKDIDSDVVLPKEFRKVAIVLDILMILLIITIFIQESIKNTIKIVLAISLIALLFVLMHLYEWIAKSYKEKIQVEIIEKEKQYYYKQIVVMQEYGEKLRSFRHDMNNHMAVIINMIEKDGELAKKYIEGIVNKVESLNIFSDTGNITIDSVINYKLSVAEEKHITVNVDIAVPNNIGMENEDIVTVFGNILDNAIEANDADNIDIKFVSINVKYKQGMLFIKCINSYDGSINIKNDKIETKKNNKELHGMGLKSIQSVVDKYDGVMNINYNDRKFEMEIALYV